MKANKKKTKLLAEQTVKEVPTTVELVKNKSKDNKPIDQKRERKTEITLITSLDEHESRHQSIYSTQSRNASIKSQFSKSEFNSNVLNSSVVADNKGKEGDQDAERTAAELLQEFWDTAWEICSERFHAKTAPVNISVDLRDLWLRVCEVEWLDLEMAKNHQQEGPREHFLPDEPPLPLSYDTWSRGVLEEFPTNKRESVLDPFVRSYANVPVSVPQAMGAGNVPWIDGNLLLGIQQKTKVIKNRIPSYEEEEDEEEEEAMYDGSSEASSLGKSKQIKTTKVKSESKVKKTKSKLGKQRSKNIGGSKEKSLTKLKNYKSTSKTKSKAKTNKSKKELGKKSKKLKLKEAKKTRLFGSRESEGLEPPPSQGQTLAPANSEASLEEDLAVGSFTVIKSRPTNIKMSESVPAFPQTTEVVTQTDPPPHVEPPVEVLKGFMQRPDSRSSVDISKLYQLQGTTPWKPVDCGRWVGDKGGVFVLPRQTTAEALIELQEEKREEIVQIGPKRQVEFEERDSEEDEGINEEQTEAFLSVAEEELEKVPTEAPKNKLTRSETEFFDRKMQAFRIKLIKQDEMKDNSRSKAQLLNLLGIGVGVGGGGGDAGHASGQSGPKHKRTYTKTKIPVPLKSKTKLSKEKGKVSIVSIPKEEEEPVAVADAFVDEEALIARLSQKGVRLPEFPSDSDIRRRKLVLAQHSLFTSAKYRQIFDIRSKNGANSRSPQNVKK